MAPTTVQAHSMGFQAICRAKPVWQGFYFSFQYFLLESHSFDNKFKLLKGQWPNQMDGPYINILFHPTAWPHPGLSVIVRLIKPVTRHPGDLPSQLAYPAKLPF